MHEEAEFGIASHLLYKEIGDSKNINNRYKKKKIKNIGEKISWTKDLLKSQETSPNKDF